MINIQDVIPFMKKGWVAMDRNGDWYWYEKEPYINQYHWESKGACESFKDFGCLKDVAPANDWTNSLIKVGGNDEK